MAEDEESQAGNADLVEFGQWLDARRQELGLLASQVAKASGYTPTHWSRIRHGTVRIRRDKVNAIAAALSLDPTEVAVRAGYTTAQTQVVYDSIHKVMRRIDERLNFIGMTKKDLAEVLGVDYGALRSWFSAGNDPGIRRVEPICQALGVSPNWLFGMEDMERIPVASMGPEDTAGLLQRNEAMMEEMLRTLRSLRKTQRTADPQPAA